MVKSEKKMDPSRTILVNGPPRTGSTVIYNLLLEICEAYRDKVSVASNHNFFPDRFLCRIVSFRDPRDMICSDALSACYDTYVNEGIEAALTAAYNRLFIQLDHARLTLAKLEMPDAIAVRYESYLPDRMETLIKDLARWIRVKIKKDQIAKLTEKYSIVNQLNRIRNLKSFNEMDEFYLHGRHITNFGRSFNWTTLFTPNVTDLVKSDVSIRKYCKRLGYVL